LPAGDVRGEPGGGGGGGGTPGDTGFESARERNPGAEGGAAGRRFGQPKAKVWGEPSGESAFLTPPGP